MSEILIPSVVTTIDGNERVTNLVSYDLAVNRTVYLIGQIDDISALNVVTGLRWLAERGHEDVTLIINSPGGSVTAGMFIYDTIQSLGCDVVTLASGVAASMAAFLLAAGTRGKRWATPEAEIMIHQPLGGVSGQATDISNAADHILRVKRRLAAILSENCGKPLRTVLKDTERDHYMTAEEAKAYGIIDNIGFCE